MKLLLLLTIIASLLSVNAMACEGQQDGGQDPEAQIENQLETQVIEEVKNIEPNTMGDQQNQDAGQSGQDSVQL